MASNYDPLPPANPGRATEADALSREADRYHNLVDQASDGIFISDGQGVYLEANESGARMLGMTREEIVGRHVRDIIVIDAGVDLAADLAELGRGKIVVRERRFRRKDGTTFSGEVSVKRLADGRLQGMLRDISVRKIAEDALRQSEERLRHLTAAAFEGICIQERGVILDVNDQLAGMLGYEREELIGRHVLSLFAPESLATSAVASSACFGSTD